MTPKVPQHIRRRLAAVINDLKNAVGQKAAKAYLARISNVKPLEFEPGAEIYDDLWMEYINKDYITGADDSSYPTPFSPYKKSEEPFLQLKNSQIEADPCYPASSP